VGVYVGGPVDATLERVFVEDTRPAGLTGIEGMGILADIQDRRKMELVDSRVAGGAIAGVLLAGGTRAVVRRSTIQDIGQGLGVFVPHQFKRGFGDGLLVRSGTTLELEDSLVSGNARAGVLFFGGGSVRRSVFRDGLISIDVEDGDPEIDLKSNVMEGNQENRISFGSGLQAPRLPSPPPSP
jgi:hypothetical protein